MKNIAVIGSGSWGMALSLVLNRNGHHVKMWSYNKDEANSINNNRKCVLLPNVIVPNDIVCYTDLEETIKDVDIVLIVTPSKAVRTTINNLKLYVKENQIFVSCSKGMESETEMNFTDIIKEILPNVDVAVLSGPSHAEEVAENIPTAVVVASEKEETLEELQKIFMNENFRVYTNTDVIGVELGGTFKNIIALCCGVAIGLEYGDNTIAAIITRGLLEIVRIGEKKGANKETFYGLTGLGDLFVTCSSKHSRNRRCGILIGQGKPVDEAVQEVGMVVEGINAVDGAYKLAKKLNVEAPIISEMYELVHNNKDPKQATINLMNRGKKAEF